MSSGRAEVFVFKKDKYDSVDAFSDNKMSFDLGPCQIRFDFSKIFQ
jgi:hypothetical protein